MIKRIATALAAGALAAGLALPVASACPSMDKAKQQTAEKQDKEAKREKTAKKATKTTKEAKKNAKKVATKTQK